MFEELKRVSDVIGSSGDFGECARPEEVADRDLIILGYELFSTQWGPAVKIYVDDGGQERAVLTWSKVIGDRISRLDGKFPVVGRFVKQKRYWTIE